MKTINSKSTKADIYEAFQALKDRHTTMRQERDDLQKQVDQLTNLLKITQAHEKAVTKARNTSYPTPTIKSTDYVNIENSTSKSNKAHIQAEADRHVKQIPVPQDTLNEKIDKAALLPSPAQLRCFAALCTHYNFPKGYKIPMPQQFDMDSFRDVIDILNAVPKSERPGKPVKPDNPADMPSYYADCNAYYERRKKAMRKLVQLYPAAADYIWAALK